MTMIQRVVFNLLHLISDMLISSVLLASQVSEGTSEFPMGQDGTWTIDSEWQHTLSFNICVKNLGRIRSIHVKNKF